MCIFFSSNQTAFESLQPWNVGRISLTKYLFNCCLLSCVLSPLFNQSKESQLSLISNWYWRISIKSNPILYIASSVYFVLFMNISYVWYLCQNTEHRLKFHFAQSFFPTLLCGFWTMNSSSKCCYTLLIIINANVPLNTIYDVIVCI